MKDIQMPYEECLGCFYWSNTLYRDELSWENPRLAVSQPMDETKSCGQEECELEKISGGFLPPLQNIIKLKSIKSSKKR